MQADRDAGTLDLSGVWNGVYSYALAAIDTAPVSFVATIAEAGAAITGATEETLRGRVNRATLRGRRDGRAVAFVKRYDRAPFRPKIQYEGELNGDATEIRGGWRIFPFARGAFLMIRARPEEVAVARETVAQV
jgi:hypothetical protein